VNNANIGELIRARRTALGLTLKAMQEKTGIDNGNLSKIERGLTSLTNESMQILADAFQVTLPELFTDPRKPIEITSNISDSDGDGDILRVSSLENLSLIPQEMNVTIGALEVRPDPQHGGHLFTASEARPKVFFGGDIKKLTAKPQNLAAFEVEDAMMEPRLYVTDTVVVDLGDQVVPQESGVFAVILDGERVVIRRLAPLPGRALRVMLDNPAYVHLDFALSAQQAAAITIVGRVKHRRGNAGF
jgi:transcriptional regulator with XRE-family HTH domain